MENNTVYNYLDKLVVVMMTHGPRIILAMIVLFFGLRIIKGLAKLINNTFEKGRVDPTLRPFMIRLLEWGLKLLLFISVASMIGIETTSFVAVLGAAGLAVGMSLQGTLSNFAGGVLILLLRPYKVGDWIDVQDEFGGVEEIGIFNTVLVTINNKTVIIPNGAIMNGNIVNVSTKGQIRVEIKVGIAYDSDLKKAKNVLLTSMKEDSEVMHDPEPFVGVQALGDSAIQLALFVYCKPEKYWEVYFRVLENAKLVLDASGIEIPFNQVDVHLKQK